MSQIEKDILIAVIGSTSVIIALTFMLVLIIYKSQKRIQQKQLEMFNAVFDAQEKEQERIARDLHDHIGPLLSIIKSQVECIDERSLSAIDREIKTDVGQQIGNALKDVRSIAHNLVPKTFSEYGFITSLKYYILRIGEYNSNIKILFNLPQWPENIEKSYEIALYRVVQELFQNAFKHSQATIVNFDMNIRDKHLTMHYQDNGVGFSEGAGNGIGIKNIRARIKLMDGDCKIESQPGKGASFDFSFDLNKLYARY